MTETCLAEHEIERLFLRMSEGREVVATRSALGVFLLHAEHCYRCRSLAEEFAADYKQQHLLPGRSEDEAPPLYAMAADTGEAASGSPQAMTVESEDGLVRCVIRRNPLGDGAYGVLFEVAASRDDSVTPEISRQYALVMDASRHRFNEQGRLDLPSMPGTNPPPDPHLALSITPPPKYF